nr:ABC transporter ATP-binding protein [Nocardiopsis salina]
MAPQAGRVHLFGTPVHTRGFRPEIGLVMQNPDDQLFCASVRHDVAFGPQNLGLPPEQVRARTEEALALTGTTDLADRVPHHLSGGQRRMVSVAAVLALRPRLVVYDEPTASLDLRARRRLVDFLRTSTHTLLVASHDLEFVLEVCDRVAVVDAGRVVAEGEPCAVMGRDRLMQAHGLERPASLATRPPIEG